MELLLKNERYDFCRDEGDLVVLDRRAKGEEVLRMDLAAAADLAPILPNALGLARAAGDSGAGKDERR